jgi:cardiolipin synthase
MMSHLSFPTAFFFFEFILRVYLCYTVITRRLSVGVSWGWICLILFLPIIGTVTYLNLGEYRLGRRRTSRIKAVQAAIHRISAHFQKTTPSIELLPETSKAFAKAAHGLFKSPLIPGNDIELLKGADETFPQLIADINAAKISCDLEFYIWSDGGRADEIAEALMRAAQRKVQIRLLVDQIGSAKFIKGKIAKRLIASGVDLCAALPSGLIRSLIRRPDLRVHRKIIVIDGSIAYTGSINLADPRLFKKSSGVGQWVDAFCRIQGPAVKALEIVFLSDWCVEKGIDFGPEERKFHLQDNSVRKTAQIQCLPSGPAIKNSTIEQTLITAIYSAKTKITLTTPYFVPNEQILYALIAAASKGIEVTLVVPNQVDSKLIQYASRAFLRDLAHAGVKIKFYNIGLLHTKSVTVDDEFCLFGSLNLDPRSLRINFEITLAIYEKKFVLNLENLQAEYIKNSLSLDLGSDYFTSGYRRFKEDLARLLGPIL